MRTFSLRDLLLLLAVICFALEVIGLDVKINLVALGLAFGFASFLVGSGGMPLPRR